MGAIAADDPLFTLAAFAALRPGDDPPDILALLTERPEWHAEAACRGRGTAVFFAGSTDTARTVCDGCPVVAECAEAGQDERDGVWGGMTAQERRQDRRNAA